MSRTPELLLALWERVPIPLRRAALKVQFRLEDAAWWIRRRLRLKKRSDQPYIYVLHPADIELYEEMTGERAALVTGPTATRAQAEPKPAREGEDAAPPEADGLFTWHTLTFARSSSPAELTLHAPLTPEGRVHTRLAYQAGQLSLLRTAGAPALVLHRRGNHWYFDAGEEIFWRGPQPINVGLLRFGPEPVKLGVTGLGYGEERYRLLRMKPASFRTEQTRS